MTNNIVITNALRTAVGSLGKSLKNIPAPNLASEVILSLLKNSNIKNNEIDEIILGQVLTGSAGQNWLGKQLSKLDCPKKYPLTL